MHGHEVQQDQVQQELPTYRAPLECRPPYVRVGYLVRDQAEYIYKCLFQGHLCCPSLRELYTLSLSFHCSAQDSLPLPCILLLGWPSTS